MFDHNKRGKDRPWEPLTEDGSAPTWERIQTAILMDLRDELKKMNSLLHCHNTIAVPALLRKIARNTAPKKKRVVKK